MKRIWIDVETTGLDPKKCGIWQLAAISEVYNPEVRAWTQREFNSRMFPGGEVTIERTALQVGGITVNDLLNYEPQEAVFRRFLTWMEAEVTPFDKTDKYHFYAYNAHFDVSFVREWFLRNENKWFGAYFWSNPVDVMTLAGEMCLFRRNEMDNFKLGTVADVFGVKPQGDLHDAMTDIKLTRGIYYSIEGRQFNRIPHRYDEPDNRVFPSLPNQEL